jgi:hypothetical protein
MAKDIDETDDGEEARYSRAYFATHDSVRETLMRVEIALGRVKLDLEQQLALLSQKADLVGRQSRLEAARQAFSQGRSGINPPAQNAVGEIQDILRQIRALTGSAAAVKSAISLATQAFSLFNRIQTV